MGISKEDDRAWAKTLIYARNEEFELSEVYEAEVQVEEFPDPRDQVAILDEMYEARLEVTFD